MKTKKCCVFGHRRITDEAKLKVSLTEIIENLIINENVDTFYIGSRSDFDSLCRKVLSEQKKIHSHIKRIYVRAEFPHINKNYKNYLLESCEGTYFPKKAQNAGKAVYVERNREMIDKSDICIVYYKDDYLPPERKKSQRDLTYYQPKSGTGIAYKYAVQKSKIIINLAEDE